jgi:hypothetical protein
VAEHLNKQRLREADAFIHSAKARAFRRLGVVASLGLYRHKDLESPALMAAVSRERKIAYHRRILQDALASSMPPDLASAQMDQVRHSVSALGELVTPDHRAYVSTKSLLASVLASAADASTREACLASLAHLSSGHAESPQKAEPAPDATKSASVGSQ